MNNAKIFREDDYREQVIPNGYGIVRFEKVDPLTREFVAYRQSGVVESDIHTGDAIEIEGVGRLPTVKEIISDRRECFFILFENDHMYRVAWISKAYPDSRARSITGNRIKEKAASEPPLIQIIINGPVDPNEIAAKIAEALVKQKNPEPPELSHKP